MPVGSRSLQEEDGWKEGEKVVRRHHRKGFEEEMKTGEVVSEKRGHTSPGAAVHTARPSLREVTSWLSWGD